MNTGDKILWDLLQDNMTDINNQKDTDFLWLFFLVLFRDTLCDLDQLNAFCKFHSKSLFSTWHLPNV